MNVLGVTSAFLRNFVGTCATATTGTTIVSTTSTNTVIKVSTVLVGNPTTATLGTAAFQVVTDGTAFTLCQAVDVDPSQEPTILVDRSSPVYLTGSQSLRVVGSSTNLVAVASFEVLQ